MSAPSWIYRLLEGRRLGPFVLVSKRQLLKLLELAECTPIPRLDEERGDYMLKRLGPHARRVIDGIRELWTRRQEDKGHG